MPRAWCAHPNVANPLAPPDLQLRHGPQEAKLKSVKKEIKGLKRSEEEQRSDAPFTEITKQLNQAAEDAKAEIDGRLAHFNASDAADDHDDELDSQGSDH